MYTDRNCRVKLLRKAPADALAMFTLNGFGCLLMNATSFFRVLLFNVITSCYSLSRARRIFVSLHHRRWWNSGHKYNARSIISVSLNLLP